MLAKTLDAGLHQLQRFIDHCGREGDRRGYFASLLWQATALVAADLSAELYAHPEYVERLQLACINRYLSAVHAWDQRRSLGPAWTFSFRQTTRPAPLIQHLLLAYQTHLSLDVGQALAEVVPRSALNAFLQDFQRQMQVLAGLIEQRPAALAAAWPLYHRLLRVLGKSDRALVGFSGANLSEQAWDWARRLSVKGEDERDEAVVERDLWTAQSCAGMGPGSLAKQLVLTLLSKTERGSVQDLIAGLHQRVPGVEPVQEQRGAA